MTVGSSDYLGDKDPARPRLTILPWHETAAGSSSLTFPRPEEEEGEIKLRVTLFVVTPAPRKNRHYPPRKERTRAERHEAISHDTGVMRGTGPDTGIIGSHFQTVSDMTAVTT